MTVEYHKSNQVVTPVLVAVSVLVLLLEKMNTSPGTLYAAVELVVFLLDT